MTTRGSAVVGMMVIAVLAMTIAVLDYQLPLNTFLWREIQNTGHTPFFGVISLLLLGISLRTLDRRLKHRWHHYLLALGACIFLGAVTEFAQLIGPRDADFGDLIRDIAGAISFLGVFMYFDRGMKVSISFRQRMGVLALALAVLVISFVPLALLSETYVHRSRAFPVICDFDSRWSRRFLSTTDARVEIVRSPDVWLSGRGKVGKLTLRSGDFPGMAIVEPYPDWREYTALRFDLYSPADTAIIIRIRIEDSHHNDEYTDRFNKIMAVLPGDSQISIPISDVRVAPAGRELDLGSVGPIHIFTVNLIRQHTLFIDNIRLE
ncbi:MAG: VanZ family protein [Candidatus Zixiibacteriota bacterium]|nr:MAG: VanZ family protein [candidate division Zixibacteria bacterium]